MTKTEVYINMADILQYPDAALDANLRRSAELVRFLYPNLQNNFDQFCDVIGTLHQAAREELYVGTFDVQASCCLDLGFVIFGEDYKRGRMLVHMQELNRQHEVDAGVELADHLPVVLRLLTRMSWTDARELVAHIILPALARMIDGLNRSNPYRVLLELIDTMIRQDYDCKTLMVDFGKYHHNDGELPEEMGEA